MNHKVKLYIAPFLLVIGVCMIGFGVWNGESKIVLEKAIRICLECIGIG